MAIHHWNNHKIEVMAHALAKYFWCAIKFSVKVDDKEIFETSGSQLKLKDAVSFHIKNGNEVIKGKMITTPPSTFLYSRYQIIIDGTEAINGKTKVDNWYIPYGIMSLCVLLLLFVYIR